MNGSMQYPGAYATSYGAAPTRADFQVSGLDAKSPFNRGGLTTRKSVPSATLGMSLIVPWFVFALVYTLEFMPLHYHSPQIVNLFVLAAAMGCVCLCILAANAWRRRLEGTDPFWHIFLAVTAILGLVVGFIGGLKNFEDNVMPYMDISNLNAYSGIDPSVSTGQQMMDAGRIKFTAGSQLNTKLSMGFKNLETYCVAPVVANASAKPDTYDFWAVGLNCCSGHLPDFHCGEFSNPNAVSGVRLMREDYRGYFNLAVQQAEAAYNIKAEHPIFVYWLQEPLTEINAYQDDAYRVFLAGLGVSMGVQLFLLLVALFIFHKS